MKLLIFSTVVFLLFWGQLCKAEDNTQPAKQEAVKQQITELEGNISRQDDGIAETEKKLQAEEISPVAAAEKIQWYTSEKQRYAASLDKIKQSLPATLTGPDLAKKQKALLDAYKRATKAVNDAATKEITRINAARTELQNTIDAARAAFQKAKDSKLKDIDQSSKTVSDTLGRAQAELKHHQTDCDHIKAIRMGKKIDPTEHNRAIHNAEEAIAAARTQLAENQTARQNVAAKSFESSENYGKINKQMLEFPRLIQTVQTYQSKQLIKLSSQYASQLRSIRQ